MAQKPIEGVSMVYSFDDAKAPSRHQTQYFEMVANRGIYDRGWVACTTPRRLPWVTLGGATDNPADDFAWELYHVAEDFSESDNLAQSNPRKLARAAGPLVGRGGAAQRPAAGLPLRRAGQSGQPSEPEPGPHHLHLLSAAWCGFPKRPPRT